VQLQTLAMVIVDLAIIAVLASLLGALARRLGQPAVIGEILAGILLGPTLFDGAISTRLYPADVISSLTAVSTIGVCAFMFLVGLEFDRELVRGQGRITITVSVSAMVVPLLLGALLGLYLSSTHASGDRLTFVLFIGVAMSVTAFPVLARILTDQGLIRTPIGGVALACAAAGDVLAWSLLAVVVALAGTGGDHWRILLIVPYAATMHWVVRPLLARLATEPARRLTGPALVVAVLIGLTLSAYATDWMGLHSIFGAFLFGVVMPRVHVVPVYEQAIRWLRRICAILLLPVFFAVSGRQVNLSALDTSALGDLGLILLVAIGGKLGGAFLGARITGVRSRHAAVLAILLDTRGLTELIVLSVGLQLGLLDPRLFSLMVVMAVVTTAMTGVLLRVVYPPRRIKGDTESAQTDGPWNVSRPAIPT
jgi:Kef-type K+ transport system membrane component KefB